MAWNLDSRTPLTLLADPAALTVALAAGPPAAVLVPAPPGSMPAGAVAQASFEALRPHALACACCQGRGPVAEALDRLFLARVRGQSPWFERVLALAETAEALALLRAALREDAVTAARFRLVG